MPGIFMTFREIIQSAWRAQVPVTEGGIESFRSFNLSRGGSWGEKKRGRRSGPQIGTYYYLNYLKDLI